MMSFMKGMAAGLVVGAAVSIVALPKPKKYSSHLKRSAVRAGSSLGELVDSVISILN